MQFFNFPTPLFLPFLTAHLPMDWDPECYHTGSLQSPKWPKVTRVPKSIKLTSAPNIMTLTTINGNGTHHVECDLCGSDITLTITANSHSFYRHRHSEACLRIWDNGGHHVYLTKGGILSQGWSSCYIKQPGYWWTSWQWWDQGDKGRSEEGESPYSEGCRTFRKRRWGEGELNLQWLLAWSSADKSSVMECDQRLLSDISHRVMVMVDFTRCSVVHPLGGQPELWVMRGYGLIEVW